MFKVIRVGERPLKARGFTIVELLIVIVVIAILAAISIVAYTGIQQRAYNSQLIGVVKTYRDALLLFKEEGKGAMPYPQLEAGVDAGQCLGTGYTLTYSSTSDYCWIGDAGYRRENAAFNALLSEYMPTVPKITPPRAYTFSPGGGSPQTRSGAIFIRGTYTPANEPRIEYLLDGTGKDCNLPGSIVESASYFGATRCILKLPY